jgi:hypothetical protein
MDKNTDLDLLHDLILPTEDMRVILLKSSDPREPSERATQLIPGIPLSLAISLLPPMQDAEIRESKRQFIVRVGLLRVHETMAGAIHRLQAELLVLDLDPE